MTSARRALAWSFAERYAAFVIGLASTLLLSRLLTPAQVGVFSLSASLLGVLAILRDFGVSEYLIQEREITAERQRAATGVALAVAWLLAAAVFAGRHAVAAYFEEPAVATVLGVMALSFVLLPLTSPAFALMNRELAFRQIALLQAGCSATAALVSVGLALGGAGTLSLAWGPVAGVALQTLVLACLRPADVFVRPSLALARPVLRFGWMYMSARFTETAAKNVCDPVIAKRFDFEAVGLFSRASGMVEMFHANVADAVVRVSTPAFAAEHRAGRPVGLAFAHATGLFVSISWPFFGFVALCAPEIVRLMFGPQWAGAAPIATVLALAALPGGLYEMVPQLLSATGHVHRRLRLAAWVAPFHIVAVLLASRWSLQAVAAVGFFSSLFMLALLRSELHAVLGMRMRVLLRPCAASAALAGLSVAGMAVVAMAARAAGWPDWGVLPCTLLAGAAAWWVAARAMGHPACAELLRAWNGMRNARQRRA